MDCRCLCDDYIPHVGFHVWEGAGELGLRCAHKNDFFVFIRRVITSHMASPKNTEYPKSLTNVKCVIKIPPILKHDSSDSIQRSSNKQ